MRSRAVVAAVALLAVVAVADALRPAVRADPDPRPREARLTSWRIDRGPPPCRSLVPDACGRYLVLAGAVQRSGKPFLGPGALADGFPRSPQGRVEAVRVADGPDDVLAVAVVDRTGRGAIELWREDGGFAGAFGLAPAAFAGGLGFSPGGHLVATFDDRGRATLYDPGGNEVAVAGGRRPG